jgi:hypothetical protein
MITIKYLIITLTLGFSLISCNESLTPDDKIEGAASFSGTIYFEDDSISWPDTTEMFGIRVGAFKTSDPSSLIGEVIDGNAYFTFQSLGTYQNSINYTINVGDAPVQLEYIVVAWQFQDSITAQRVAAVYGGEQQQSLILNPGDSLTGINFNVDFDNLPPQPF